MKRLSARRCRWMTATAWSTALSVVGAIGTGVWILVAPHALAAIQGMAVLCACLTVGCCSVMVTVTLRLTYSPALSSILRILNESQPAAEPALRLVLAPKARSGG